VTRPKGFKPLFGRLPREEGKSAVAVVPSAGAAPARPVEVHNIELDASDKNMYGNGGTEVLGVAWGDCVHVMIEKDRVISAEALGVKITKLTPAQVVKNYCDQNGVPFVASAAPGPGSNILNALKWAQNHPERFAGSKLLFYGDFPITDEGMKQAVAEFMSVCVGVEVYGSMEYPAPVWYVPPKGRLLGGHGIAGGSYTALYNFIKTWGYMVEVNSAGFGTIDELVVLVWDFQWAALTYERQLACIASYVFATGKTWTGPAPVAPPPTPPAPTPPYTPRTAVNYVAAKPFRFADSRGEPAITHPPKLQRGLNSIQIGGVGGVPADATAVVLKLEIIYPSLNGWVEAGPDSAKPGTSVNWFSATPLGPDGKPLPSTRAWPMNFIASLAASGILYIWLESDPVDWDMDVRGWFTP
jgi:hypothetical protein